MANYRDASPPKFSISDHQSRLVDVLKARTAQALRAFLCPQLALRSP
ncbi:hypothetical protein [Enterobacter cloacae complex sp. 277I4]